MSQFEIPDAEAIAETSDAVLIEAPYFDKPEWFPQSQITDDSEVWKKGDKGVLVVTEWIMERKGML